MAQGRKVIIIGGGAAGMTAAITAARNGAKVLVLERMSRVGKKILATGNGRCNLTNLNPDLCHYHGSSPEFALGVLQQFDTEKTLVFFRELGVLTRTEDGGKVFPITDQASSVLDALRYALEELGAEVVCDTNVQRIERRKTALHCICTDGREFSGDAVILATGGKSAPNLGSNGGGFKIAADVGHQIVPPFPALVQVRLDSPYLKQLAGTRIQAGVEAFSIMNGNRQTCRKESGELLFTDYGISGIPVFHLSRFVSEHFSVHKDEARAIMLSVDLFPEMTQFEIHALIRDRIGRNPARPLDICFVGMLHKRLIPVILKESGITEIHAECGSLPEPAIIRITTLLKDLVFRCMGTQSWMTSQVTAGGVDVRQVDRCTLESRIFPGLFFAGEVLDIDGDCGGYNLQWAWSSGYIAGLNSSANDGEYHY